MAGVVKGSQFYLHTPHTSANGMNHTCLCLPSWSWYSFTNPEGMEGWVGLVNYSLLLLYSELHWGCQCCWRLCGLPRSTSQQQNTPDGRAVITTMCRHVNW